MPNRWVISDTHFGHQNIIEYSERPFKSVEEMNQTMIDNWNSVIKPSDKVYHLGDVGFFKSVEDCDYILNQLNGKKRLIIGNHDQSYKFSDQELYKHFEKVMCTLKNKRDGWIMSHYPLYEEHMRNEEFMKINIHGHTHEINMGTEFHTNVSVEQTNYTPIALEDILSNDKI